MPQFTLKEFASVFGITGMDQHLEKDSNMFLPSSMGALQLFLVMEERYPSSSCQSCGLYPKNVKTTHTTDRRQ